MQQRSSQTRTIRIGEVARKTGLSRSSIWRLAKIGFPKPVKLSPACTAWFEHEIDEWLMSKRSGKEN